jgi:hypothetical protein
LPHDAGHRDVQHKKLRLEKDRMGSLRATMRLGEYKGSRAEKENTARLRAPIKGKVCSRVDGEEAWCVTRTLKGLFALSSQLSQLSLAIFMPQPPRHSLRSISYPSSSSLRMR